MHQQTSRVPQAPPTFLTHILSHTASLHTHTPHTLTLLTHSLHTHSHNLHIPHTLTTHAFLTHSHTLYTHTFLTHSHSLYTHYTHSLTLPHIPSQTHTHGRAYTSSVAGLRSTLSLEPEPRPARVHFLVVLGNSEPSAKAGPVARRQWTDCRVLKLARPPRAGTRIEGPTLTRGRGKSSYTCAPLTFPQMKRDYVQVHVKNVTPKNPVLNLQSFHFHELGKNGGHEPAHPHAGAMAWPPRRLLSRH